MDEIVLKDGTVATDRRLDRVKEFDPESKLYPIRAMVPPKPLETKVWDLNCWFDQGQEGACVGHGWGHEICAEPFPRTIEHSVCFDIYRGAQLIDDWPGENYSGTSVLAGAKMAVNLGFIQEYRWAFGLQDLLDALSHFGPAVLGVNWYEGMSNPDADGYIRPTGQQTGGHCIVAIGVNVEERYVLLHNSWGTGWGENGRCKISWDDLATLLEQGGEACIPVTRL